MESLSKFLSTPIIEKEGKTLVSFGTITTLGIGALILYYSIPERKRRNLF